MNSNKTISILGCGWLGLELGKSLIQEGYSVKGSTTSPDKLPLLIDANIIPFLIDLDTADDENFPLFFQTDILVVAVPPGRRDPDYKSKHLKRIERVAINSRKFKVQNILMVSSTGVYASKVVNEPEWNFPEYADQPPKTKGSSKSAATLIQAEQILISSNKEHASIIRFGGLVGGDRLAGRFLAGKKNVDNGMAPVNMIHRDDCIGIIKSIIDKNQWGKIFNATADEHPSRKDFYTAQASKYGFETPTFLQSSCASGKIVSNKPLIEAINYTFLHPDPMQF